MSLSRFVAAVLFLVTAGLLLTFVAGVVTYGVSLELGYPPVEGKGYTALLGGFVGAAITLAACTFACAVWVASERRALARVFMPRDAIVVVAVAVPHFVLWWPIAAVVGLAIAVVLYGLGLVVGYRRAMGSTAPAPHLRPGR